MIMPQLIINIYVSLMYELKENLESYLPVNLLWPVPRFIKKKKNSRAAVSQKLRNTEIKENMKGGACITREGL